jgi:hypothetical protein
MAHLSHIRIFNLSYFVSSQGEIGTETRYSTDLTAQILYVGYAFLVVILLSNVLIAIVTDSYEIIQNDRAAIVFWSNRLDFVAEMDAITYGINTRLGYCRRNQKGAPGTVTEVQQQEGPNSPGLVPEDTSGSKQPFREAWKSVMFLFDANLYEEIDWLEFFVYMLFRIFAVVFVIPLWLALGLVTAGWLWPPQVREFLFVQKEAAVSRSELERRKLGKLKSIHTDLKNLKTSLMREMSNDRDEMIRMKAEIEAVQNEVIADLHQVKDLMSSLII